MTYVLDESSVGLHPRDNARLLGLLRQLVDQGNSVIVVEHDEDTMMAADWLIDIGPGAGSDGGRVLYTGPPRGILAPTDDPDLESSLTRRFLLRRPSVPKSLGDASGRQLQVRAAKQHNLTGFDVSIPTGVLTVVTGVSGAGKSSFLAELRDQTRSKMDQLIEIDQRPIGRTPRSNTATYVGLFDHVRRLCPAAKPSASSWPRS